VAAGAHWCTLCYTDLRPKPQPAAAAEPAAHADELVVDEADTEPEESRRRRGKHARPAAGSDADPDVQGDATPGVDVDVIAAQMLAQLAASETSASLGRFSGVVDSPGKKVGVMVGGAVLAMVLLFGLMAVLGALL
jgi:hypothetical protein